MGQAATTATAAQGRTVWTMTSAVSNKYESADRFSRQSQFFTNSHGLPVVAVMKLKTAISTCGKVVVKIGNDNRHESLGLSMTAQLPCAKQQ